MATVVVTDSDVVVKSWVAWSKTLLVGAFLGFMAWIMTVLVTHYVIEPIVCRQLVNATLCLNAQPLAGTIAAVLTAAVAVVVLVKLGLGRPIIVAVATAALLWSLGEWTEGLFWGEAFAWSVFLYTASYGLFAWVARYAPLGMAIVMSILIVLVIRIALVI